MYKLNWKYIPLIAFVDFLGYILIRPFLRKTFPFIQKILVIRVDEIGDAILSTPVFLALRQRFPSAEICALIKPLTKEVYANNKNIDRIILADSWLSSWAGQGASLFSFFRLIRQLRRESFDLVVELHTDPRNILLASLVGKYCIGYGYRGFGFLLNKKAKPSNKHIIEQCLDVVRLLGADTPPLLELLLQENSVITIRKKLAAAGFDIASPKHLVCISPGAGRANKLWFNNSWAKLVSALLKKRNTQIIFAGTASEAKIVDEIMALLGNTKKILNLCGKTSLQELFALVSHCSMVIAPDSAIIHIANACSTPSIGLYGPTDPSVWGYNTQLQKSIFRKLNCSFCDKAGCSLRSNKNKCMEWLSSEDVLHELETFI